jgi:hypothetical protein
MKSSISRSAAWRSILAVVTYQLVLAALIFIRPDLDPSWHTIREWAIGPHGWIMSAAFLVSAQISLVHSPAAGYALIEPPRSRACLTQ